MKILQLSAKPNVIFSSFIKLSLSSFLVWMSTTIPTMAGGFDQLRLAKSSNMLNCPTNKVYEYVNGHSNISYSDGNLSLVCLENENKAKWLIYAGTQCEEPMCKKSIVNIYFNSSFDERTNTYTYQIPQAVIGQNCRVVEKKTDKQWSCQKIQYRQNFTLKTMGKTPTIWIGKYIEKYGKFPEVFLNIQGVKRTSYIECFGSSSFCKY